MKSIYKFVYLIFAVAVLAVIAGSFRRAEVITQTHIAMGTTARISIVVKSPSKKNISRTYSIINEAFSKLRYYEQLFDFYSEDSELGAVNKIATEKTVKISEKLSDILAKAFEYSHLTEGVFDVTATSLQKEDGYGSIVFNRQENTVRFTDKKAKIDLGGIATGYAIDKIAEYFEKLNIKNYLIDIGGDIYAHGVNARGQLWQVGVRNPLEQKKIIEKLSIKNQAITTSGNYVKQHLIDLRQIKESDNRLLSVSVIAPLCIDADVLATTFFIIGKEKAKDFINKKRDDIKAVFIIKDKNQLKAIKYNFD